jgi:opine dehydrogenase
VYNRPVVSESIKKFTRLDNCIVRFHCEINAGVSMYKKVTILGAGNGGYAAAFDLSQRGHEVMLYESPQFASVLEPIKHKGEVCALEKIDLFEQEFTSVLHGTAKVHATTTDIQTAAEFANIFILIVPSFAHTIIFKQLMPYLNDGDIVFSLPGNYASLIFNQMLQDAGIKKDITLVDSDTIPYACRKVEDNTIFISALKRAIHIASYPAHKTEWARTELNDIFTTQLLPLSNVIAIGLSNLNLVVHPLVSLLNAARIQDKHSHFYFYTEGISEGVCRLAEKLDLERLEFGKQIHLENLPSFMEIYRTWYGDQFNSIYEAVHDKYHAFFLAPETLNNRYFTEDIPYLMMPILHYAKTHDINLPIMSSIVTLVQGLLNGEKNILQPDVMPSFEAFVS